MQNGAAEDAEAEAEPAATKRLEFLQDLRNADAAIQDEALLGNMSCCACSEQGLE